MNRLLLIPICFVALLIPVAVLASGGEGGFDGVVNFLESRYHVRATRIPFLGLISLISRRATHEGVSGMHVAQFDDFHADVDGDELNSVVGQKLGPGWERVIRETSRTSGEPGSTATGPGRRGGSQTLIYMHPEGQRMGLFILDLDGREMDVVQVSVDPNHLNESLDHYQRRHGQGDSDQADRDSDESKSPRVPR
jgi:hypothetical protein